MTLKKSPRNISVNGLSCLLKRGFTILEITVVLVVLLSLIGVSMMAMDAYRDWQKGAEAGTTLRVVYSAQRTYLAEHPTVDVADLEQADVLPYLSDGSTVFPTVDDLDGNALNIKVDVSPPVIDDGGGDTYDPSGPDDGLWDVGE